MISVSIRTACAALALASAILLAPLVAFGETEPVVADTSQEEAREAVKQGLVRPLEDVLGEVRKIITGDIVEIEFEKDEGRYIYEIEYVSPEGHLMEIKVDARTLAVVSRGQENED